MSSESYMVDPGRGPIFDKESFSLKVVRNEQGGVEILDRTEQEVSDAAYAFYGQIVLGIERRDGMFRRSSLDDWEMLEAEDPSAHERLEPTVRRMLALSGIEPPFALKLAEIHSLDEARARRDAIAELPPQPTHAQDQTAIN